MSRTSAQINAEIAALQAADRAYNRVVNEGGEGYERNSVPATLVAEFHAAKDAEFAAEWTLDVLTERRAAWNAGVNALMSKHGRNVPVEAVSDLSLRLGYGVAEIGKAKRLHGII
jgi:hypothetical protein